MAGPRRSLVGPDALEGRSAVVQGMIHGMAVGFRPVVELPHMPILLRAGEIGVRKHAGLLLTDDSGFRPHISPLDSRGMRLGRNEGTLSVPIYSNTIPTMKSQ